MKVGDIVRHVTWVKRRWYVLLGMKKDTKHDPSRWIFTIRNLENGDVLSLANQSIEWWEIKKAKK